jgi:hypothetical protein
MRFYVVISQYMYCTEVKTYLVRYKITQTHVDKPKPFVDFI